MILSGGELLLDSYSQSPYGGEHIMWGPGMVAAGVSTPNTDQSMRLSAVFACLRLLSEAICTLPLDTFRKSGDTRKAYATPDYLLFDPPSDSRIDYLSQVMLSLLTDGNAYILTPRNMLGVPLALVVLDPTMVTVERIRGRVVYHCQSVELDPRTDLMHIKGMMLPGRITGLSPLSYARETVGLGLAAQRFGSAFFDNGALPSAVIELQGDMAQSGVDRFRDTWNGSHAGVGNNNKIGILTNGAKLSKVSIAPNDAQFLETRAFQVPDVARIFGVPPHLIADASNSTSWGSGLAEQNLAFGQFSLRPWLTRIEEGHTRLLHSHASPNSFVKLNLDALLRASVEDRYTTYQTGIEARFLTINEARAYEDLPPVKWGDEPFIPERITETASTVPAVVPTQPQPTPQPDGGQP